MTEYTDNKWITRDIPDPENAKPIEVTDYLGNRIGNGFVSPETGKLCIDCSQQKTNDIAIKSVEFYLGKKLMVGMSMAEWNPVVTIPPPFDKAVITTSQKGISIILFDESVRTAENEQAR